MIKAKQMRLDASLFILVVFNFGQISWAEDVNSEIQDLKKRITQLEEGQAAKPAGGVTAGIGKSPYIQSEDGKFKMELGARVQARYTYIGRRRAHDRPAIDSSFAELERARIRIQGHVVDPRFFFRLEWDGHTDSEVLGLSDTFIQYIHKNKDKGYQMKVGAGQWKPYFGRQEKQSSSQQIMVDRSLANEFFNIDRNIGVWTEGRKEISKEGVFNAVGWEFGVSNGIDSVNKSPSDDEYDDIPAFISHIDIDWIGNLGKYALSGGDYNRIKKPGLTSGMSFLYDGNSGSGQVGSSFARYDVYQMAYDFVYKYLGFSLNAEYYGRWLDFDGSDIAGGEGKGEGGSIYTHGGYVESGYMVTEKVQIVGRTSSVWNREGPAQGSAWEAGGGFNYFFNKHNLKFSMDVNWVDISSDMIPMTEKLAGLDDASPPTAGTPGFQFDSYGSSSANLSEFKGILLRTQMQIYF